jgi:hypothetical protein
MPALTSINFDGTDYPLAPDETRTFCGTHHRHPDDVIGYAVVATRFGHGRIADVGYYGARMYGEAVELAHEVRDIAKDTPVFDYARIDVLYNDGCRGIL